MNIWIFETESGGAICEIEHEIGKVEFNSGYGSVDQAFDAMAQRFPNVEPTVERLAQPELPLGGAQ